MAERYGPCKLWFPDGYLSAVTGLEFSTTINPWLESPEGLAWRMEELGRRILTARAKTKGRHV